MVAQSEGVNLKYGQWNTVSVSAVSNGGAIRDDSVLILVSFKIDVAEESVIYIDNVQVGTRRSRFRRRFGFGNGIRLARQLCFHRGQ